MPYTNILKYLLLLLINLLFITACQSYNADHLNIINTGSPHLKDKGNIHFNFHQNNFSSLADKQLNLKRENDVAKKENNLWDVIRANASWPIDTNNPRIQKEIKELAKSQYNFNQIAFKARPFLYYVVQTVLSKKLPVELALLPIVESGYDPFAYSYAGASGLWQIMPMTGQKYNLTQNWWYDARRDIRKSTDAALNYLATLYGLLDNWEFAVAAYNSGPGRVMAAIKKQKNKKSPPHFWDLDLPEETTEYIPKLLAFIAIIKNPDTYHITLPFIPNKPFFQVVKTHGQITLKKAAEISKVTLSQLRLLNPGINKWVTPPDGADELLVPTQHADFFKNLLPTVSDFYRLNWKRYIVKNNDTLSEIAQRFKTSIQLLVKINDLDEHNLIHIGQSLIIPLNVKNDSWSMERINQIRGYLIGKQSILHQVKNGESLWLIAKKYGVTISDLKKWNNSLSESNVIQPGMILEVWKNNAVISKHLTKKIYYRIKKGDFIAKIANKFQISTTKIIYWNKLKNTVLQPGDYLVLYVNVTLIKS